MLKYLQSLFYNDILIERRGFMNPLDFNTLKKVNKVSKQELQSMHDKLGIAVPAYSHFNEQVGDLSGFTKIADCVGLDKFKLQKELKAGGYNSNQQDDKYLGIFVKRAKQDLQKHAKNLYPTMVGAMIYIDTPSPVAFPFFKNKSNNDESPLANHHYTTKSPEKPTDNDSNIAQNQLKKQRQEEDQRLQLLINFIQHHQREVEAEERKKKQRKKDKEKKEELKKVERRKRRQHRPSGPVPGE